MAKATKKHPRNTRNEYRTVENLPDGAKPISQYAKDEGISIPPVYKRYKTGKIEIVIYQGINFVLP